jgi:predicted metal-dependent hydrolase
MARAPVTTTQDWLELSAPSGGTLRVLKAVHPRARRLRLTVTPKGARLSCPRGTHPAQVSAFLRQNVEWLERKLDEMKLRGKLPAPLRVGQPTTMMLRGDSVPLLWAEGPYPRVERLEGSVRLVLPRLTPRSRPVAHGLRASFLEAQVRRDVARWLPQYVPQLQAAPTSVRIRPMRSLWGSLDTRDRINLDLALALAPPAALRYVLVHELSHLKVRNHSPRFWRQVESLMPDYDEQRIWLRCEGAALKLEIERLIADVAD